MSLNANPTEPPAVRPHAGMPPLEPAPALSVFEFWPANLFYIPVWIWAVGLSLRHLGVRLPLLANPLFPAGGLVGESKTQILDLIDGEAAAYVAPYVPFDRTMDPAEADAPRALALAAASGLALPLVAKPDLGCRGAGVRPVRTPDELIAYLAEFPAGERLLLQTLIDVEGEAGVFYLRVPGEERGRIFSLTLKYFPHVEGDGLSTLRALILADPRAGPLSHLYLPRHQARLDEVLPAGQTLRLAFAGSHSRGAIFRNGNAWVTEPMTARFDAIAKAIPEFWFGRFDVRFATFEALREGRDFSIVEVNGAGAEATHIWDSRTRLVDAYQTLFRQFALLWQIGARNRSRGFRPEPLFWFVRRWRRETRLMNRYPPTA